MNLNNVTYTEKESNQIILSNFLKMLKRRNLISDVDQTFDSVSNSIVSNKSIKIKIDNNSHVLLYIVHGKVTSITQNSPIDDFLSNETNLMRFVIIKEPSKKTFKQISENYPNSEPFFLHEFMEDIPTKDIIPIHTPLNLEEKEELLKVIQLKNLKRIFSTDMMSRYYNVKSGDVFRIERLNPTSGMGVDYRVVVQGKIDLLF
tara:strand:+ start:131 stop:739 length:609 start_codon:yes stop_codon:yes gene_type:complete